MRRIRGSLDGYAVSDIVVLMTQASSAAGWSADLRELAAELGALAAAPAEDVARTLGPLLARGAGVEHRLARCRVAALRDVVDRVGTQRAAAAVTGIPQGNISRILAGLNTREARAKMGRAQ